MKRNELDANATPSLESPQAVPAAPDTHEETSMAPTKRRTGPFVIRTGIRAGDGYAGNQDNEPALHAV